MLVDSWPPIVIASVDINFVTASGLGKPCEGPMQAGRNCVGVGIASKRVPVSDSFFSFYTKDCNEPSNLHVNIGLSHNVDMVIEIPPFFEALKV